MKKIRFGTRLLFSKLTGRKAPFQLNIHLTDRCNLRCRYCYVDFNHASKDMPLEKIREILRDAAQMGTERISLEGGDPLLHPDLKEIIEQIKAHGMECNINTNGILVPERILEIQRADILTVSIDGTQEAHDHFRGKGSFEKAVRAIEIAKEHGMKVHAMSVMTKANIDSLDFLLGFCKRMGIPFIPNTVIFHPDETKRDKDKEKEYVLEEDEWHKVFRILYEKKKQGEPIIWSLKTLRHVMSWPASAHRSRIWSEDPVPEGGWKWPRCMAGKYFCVIQTNGKLYPCDTLLDHQEGPNCFEIGFRKAFEQLTTHGCLACTSLVCGELNYLFNLSPSVIANLIENYGRRK